MPVNLPTSTTGGLPHCSTTPESREEDLAMPVNFPTSPAGGPPHYSTPDDGFSTELTARSGARWGALPLACGAAQHGRFLAGGQCSWPDKCVPPPGQASCDERPQTSPGFHSLRAPATPAGLCNKWDKLDACSSALLGRLLVRPLPIFIFTAGPACRLVLGRNLRCVHFLFCTLTTFLYFGHFGTLRGHLDVHGPDNIKHPWQLGEC